MTGALCSARLRNGDPCRSVATDGEFCAYHATLAAELGSEAVANGDHTKTRNAQQRLPVIAESEPLELNTSCELPISSPRPALALTAAEEVETIRLVLLEAATSTTRDSWATCTCPECGKGFRQEISVPWRVGSRDRLDPHLVLNQTSLEGASVKAAAKDAGQLSATNNQHGSVLNLEISKTVKCATLRGFKSLPSAPHTARPAWLSPSPERWLRVCGASACM